MLYIFLFFLIIAPQIWLQPFIGLPIDYIVYPLWLFAVLGSGGLSKKLGSAFDKFFLFFIFWVIASTIANSFYDGVIKLIVDYIKWYILACLIISSIDSFAKLKRVLIFFSFLVFMVGIQSVFHKYSDDGLGWAGQSLGWVDKSVLEAGGTGRTKWVHIFDGPGVFCVIFTTVLPFILTYMHKPFSGFTRFIAFSLVCFDLFVIYLTGSRGGLLATMAILGLHFTLRRPGGLANFKRYFALIPVLAVILMLAPSHLTNMNDDSKSASHRVDMWAQGIEMIEQNPLFGIGLGNYRDYTGFLIAHNSAIELMGELGLPGFISWLGMIFVCLKVLYEVTQQQKSNEQEKAFARALAVALVGYLVSAMFVTLEYETYYILMALCMVMGHVQGVQVEFTSRNWRWLLMFVAVWYVSLKAFVTVYVILIS